MSSVENTLNNTQFPEESPPLADTQRAGAVVVNLASRRAERQPDPPPPPTSVGKLLAWLIHDI